MHIKAVPGCLIFLVLLLSAGCAHKPKSQPGRADTVRISSPLQAQPDTDYAEYPGITFIPASGIVIISPPAGGILRSVYYQAGSFVRSGRTLATIENIEFLKMQQEYLETKSRLSYFSEELKRQGELTIENASSVKKMQQAQMDYQTCEIKLHSLSKQLAITGFNTDSIDVDHLSSQISINAPVSGYIDRVSVLPGNSIAPGQTLLVIVKNYHPVISIEIQDHFRNLKTGQEVMFFLPGDTLVSYGAHLSYIGKQIYPERHGIKVNAIPDDNTIQLIPGMHVRVRIKI